MTRPPVANERTKKRAADKAEASTQSRFQDLVRKARAGDLKWMDEAIREAGYGDPPGDEIIITSRQLENMLQLSRRQVQEYVTAGMPRVRAALGNRPATYDLWKVVPWLRNLYRKAGGLDPDEAAAYERKRRDYDLRKQKSEAEIKERQAGLEAGRLVDRDKVEVEFRQILKRFQSCLEGLPARLATIAPPGLADKLVLDSRATLQAEWNATLAELRRILPPKPAEPVAPIA